MLKAKVNRVIDGDTVEVQATLKLRLDFIDTPETKGAEREAGLISKQWLIDALPPGTIIEMDIKKFDIYNRPLSVIYKEGVNVNGEMLKLKLAEVYSPANHNNGKID
jgi:micrococcal nuclease